MRNFAHASAALPHIAGVNLPPLDLGISSEFQFCVNAGAAAAISFFGSLSDFNLHDHIALALQSFSASVAAGLAATGRHDAGMTQECSDAFVAGYLGRIQQELRLFHGEHARQGQRPAMPPTPSANVNKMN